MAEDTYSIKADFNSLYSEVAKAVAAQAKLNIVSNAHVQVLNKQTKTGNEQSVILTGLSAAGDKLSYTFRQLALSEKEAGIQASKLSGEEARLTVNGLKLVQTNEKITSSLNRTEEAANQTALALIKTLSGGKGNLKTKQQLAEAKRALLDLVAKSNLSGKSIDAMWGRVSSGNIKVYKNKVAQELQAALVKLKQASDGVSKSLRTQDSSAKNLIFSWESLARLAIAQTARASLHALTQEMREAVTVAIDFEQALAGVQTIDKTGAPFAAYVTGLRQLSDRSGIEIVDQTKAAYQALSNQVADGVQSFGFLREANDLALVGFASSEETVNLLSSAINAFSGQTLADTRSVAASFFKTVELGRNTIKEMAGDFGRLAVPANQLGVTLNEVQAAIATITVKGVKFNVASTFLRNTLLKLTKPGEELSKFIQELGFQTGEAAIASLGLGGVLHEVENRAKGSSTEIAALFQNIRAIAGATVFAGDGLEIYNDKLDAITDALNTYDDKIDLVTNNAGKQFEIAANKIKNIFVIDSALPALIKVGQLTDNFNVFVEAAQHAKSIMIVLASATLPLLAVGIVKVAASIKALTLTLAATPLGAATLALSAVIAVIGLVISESKTLEEQNTVTYLKWAEQAQTARDEIARGRRDFERKAVRGYTRGFKAISAEVAKVIGSYVKLRNESVKLNEQVASKTLQANETALKSVDALIKKTKQANSLTEKSSQAEKKIKSEILKLEHDKSLLGLDEAGKTRVLTSEITKLTVEREKAYRSKDVDAFTSANERLNAALSEKRGVVSSETAKKQVISEIIKAKKRELILNKELVKYVAEQKKIEDGKLNTLLNQRETLKTQFDTARDFDPSKLQGAGLEQGFKDQIALLKDTALLQDKLGVDSSNTAKAIAKAKVDLDNATAENLARLDQEKLNANKKLTDSYLSDTKAKLAAEEQILSTIREASLLTGIALKESVRTNYKNERGMTVPLGRAPSASATDAFSDPKLFKEFSRLADLVSIGDVSPETDAAFEKSVNALSESIRTTNKSSDPVVMRDSKELLVQFRKLAEFYSKAKTDTPLQDARLDALGTSDRLTAAQTAVSKVRLTAVQSIEARKNADELATQAALDFASALKFNADRIANPTQNLAKGANVPMLPKQAANDAVQELAPVQNIKYQRDTTVVVRETVPAEAVLKIIKSYENGKTTFRNETKVEARNRRQAGG